MPDMSGGFFILRDDTPEIIALLHKQVGQAVRTTAFDIQGRAQAAAPHDTYFLKNSIYTVTSSTSNYGKAQPVKEGQHLLPEVEKPQNDQTAYIAVGASYGIYQEYGTANMAAQPYLQPAFDAVVPAFLEAMRRIEEKFPGFNAGSAAKGSEL